MYISNIKIKNFRNFRKQEIIFNDGVNVIIGHNNAGKTNLLKALSLVINQDVSKKLDVDDFNKHTTFAELKNTPPKISIEVTIKKGRHEEEDDLVMLAHWLTKLDTEFEAKLTYEFFLPEKEKNKYDQAMVEIDETAPDARDVAWKVIKSDFIRLYTYKVWCGNLANQTVADSESLNKFDFQFLDAIRDVERDMLTGKNTLLRNVFDFFMDYEIKSDKTKTKEDIETEIKSRKNSFVSHADNLIQALQGRMEKGKEEILSYTNETGASFNNAAPNFDGSISDVEMFSFLRLIINYQTGIKVPATHNGLGYNNLIFMSLLLAKMQVNSDGSYMGSNAKVFSTLVIEEPEAHLHPAMQYKFLKFLKNHKNARKVRQIFVTTHSTHITSAVSLDEIICLHNENGEVQVGYPGKVFPLDGKSLKYVQRFLDATKSNMLFAQKILFVEGLAEQLLMSVFAQYLGKSLEDNHIAVINVGGRYFNHFLHMFDSTKSNTIFKKVICITDIDPEYKKHPVTPDDEDEDEIKHFKKCYPFEFNANTAEYRYQQNLTPAPFSAHVNISFYSQDSTYGKTLEYELVRCNPTLELLVTGVMKNQSEIKRLMTAYREGKGVDDIINLMKSSDENRRIKSGINANATWSEKDKKDAIIASRYLNSVGKGENALELSRILLENLEKKGTAEYQEFNVPSYISEAIESLCP